MKNAHNTQKYPLFGLSKKNRCDTLRTVIIVGCFKLGISYAIVTKVKELTERKQYGDALDLLEGEDIFQSLNPQFLRCCGEVYLETDHFFEGRKALVQAHVMAPEAIRIIYDLVHLYLKMGYYTRAKHYFELYECYVSKNDIGKLQLQYMLQKAQRVDAKELLGILERICEEEYTDDWGFELALLYASLGMQTKTKEECIHIMAAFRNSPYYSLAESLKKGEYDIGNSYFCFPLVEVEEDYDSYAEISAIEEEQWKKDYLKIHPPEPVILQMEDDDGSDAEEHEKTKGFRFSFGRKRNKTGSSNIETEISTNSESIEKQKKAEISKPVSENMMQEASGEQKTPDATVVQQKETDSSLQSDIKSVESDDLKKISDESETSDNQSRIEEQSSGDVSTYIESVMKSVADIEALVAEDLQNPNAFESSMHKNVNTNQDHESDADSKKAYQPKLMEVEDSLSPKERLEKLMKLIEADREEEEKKKPDLYQEEEIDMDEFLMNLVGASTITQAMVDNYREEQQNKDSNNGC